MSRYLLPPAAQADLDEIWDYTRRHWAVDRAEVYIRELAQAIERAAANPRIGRACDEIRSGYRKLAAGSHVVFDRVTDDAVIDDAVIGVVRVLHQRMDVDRHR